MATNPTVGSGNAVAPRPAWMSPQFRLGVAWLLTIALLPYAAARTIAITMLVNWPEPIYAALLAGGIIAVMGLSFALSRYFSGTWVNRHLVWLIIVPWIAMLGLLVALFNGGLLAWPWVWLAFVPATLWIAWLSWMFYAPFGWGTRLGVLVLLGGCFAGSMAALKVDGLTGGNRADFAWRWAKKPSIVWESISGQSLVADVTPTVFDYPQFLGPRRLGIAADSRLSSDWSSQPPREVWRRPVGAGWSSFAVVGNSAFTQEQRGANECVTCYRLDDGGPIWVHKDAIRFDKTLGGPGPRATPTIADGRVYAVGATGMLNCLDAATGQRIWNVDILADNQAENIDHGVCGSPLVVDNLVIVNPTGSNRVSLAAYDLNSGQRVWQGGKDRASYGSALVVDLAGTRQIVLFHSQGVAGHDLKTGEVLWTFPWTNPETVNVSQAVPVPGADGEFLVATGYGKGAAQLRVVRSPDGTWNAESVWESRKPIMQAKFTTPVFHNGMIYGLDNGILACVDPKTGKRLWIDGRYGHGQLLLAGGLLVIQAEDGRLVLVEPSPEGLRERGRIRALDGKTWNNPALAGRFLLLRNDQEAVCYELPVNGG